jgi:hypothetical protein
MDKNYISALQDTKDSIEKKLYFIEKSIKEFSSANSSSKQKILSRIKSDLINLKTDLKLMKNDTDCLTQSENQKIWKEKYSNLKSQKEKLENKIKLIQNGEVNNEDEEDYMDIDKKVDLNKLSSEQVMKRGDKILQEDEKSLQNMIKTLSKGRNMMQDTNKELHKQMEAMDRMDGDINEMDGALNRAKKNIYYMNKIA